jgi:long-chain acyl-CoA synthetase
MKIESIYEKKPWLSSYPEKVPREVEVPLKSVNDAFDEATTRWEKKAAVIFYGRKVTYGELRENVDRFSAALRSLGIRKGDRVAVLMLNSLEFLIAFFGILKAGAVISAISPSYVSPEIKHQVEDSGAETIICHDILYGGVEKTGIPFKNVILANITESLPSIKRFMGRSILKSVYQKMAAPSVKIQRQEGFLQMKKLIATYPPKPPKLEIDPMQDLVSLPYTGGTTGKPKGVMITHNNVIADAVNFQSFYSFIQEGNTNWIGYMPFYHAGGQARAVQCGILFGYTIIAITNPDLDIILKAILKYKPDIFFGAPSLFEMLKEYKKTTRVNWRNLKMVVCGADTLHQSTAKGWKERTGIELHEIYGMTELTGFTHGSPLGKQKIGSIGVPGVNVIAAIIHPDEDRYLPVGELGELAVSGPQVTKGYWNNPEETEECEARVNGIRWWRTGDIARMEEDGFFYLYDRKRDLIKYKGLRVHAREIEEALKEHPQIKEVGVIGASDVKVGENIKAYVVLETDARGKLSEEEIRRYCERNLAHYKVPKIIEFIGEIPKTDVGKVSRRELREQEV